MWRKLRGFVQKASQSVLDVQVPPGPAVVSLGLGVSMGDAKFGQQVTVIPVACRGPSVFVPARKDAKKPAGEDLSCAP